jgi:hypothetical protein
MSQTKLSMTGKILIMYPGQGELGYCMASWLGTGKSQTFF